MKRFIVLFLALCGLSFGAYDEVSNIIGTDSTFSILTADTIKSSGDSLFMKTNVRVTKTVHVDSQIIAGKKAILADSVKGYNTDTLFTQYGRGTWYGDGSNLSGIVTDSSWTLIQTDSIKGTTNDTAFTRFMRGTWYGDGSNLSGVVSDSAWITIDVDTALNNLVIEDTCKAAVFAPKSGNLNLGTGAVTDISGKVLMDTADIDYADVDTALNNLVVKDTVKADVAVIPMIDADTASGNLVIEDTVKADVVITSEIAPPTGQNLQFSNTGDFVVDAPMSINDTVFWTANFYSVEDDSILIFYFNGTAVDTVGKNP